MELTQRLIVCDMCDSEQVAVAGRKAIQWINLSGTASGASETLEPTHKWIVRQFVRPVDDAVPRRSVGRPSLTDVRLVPKVKIQDLTLLDGRTAGCTMKRSYWHLTWKMIGKNNAETMNRSNLALRPWRARWAGGAARC